MLMPKVSNVNHLSFTRRTCLTSYFMLVASCQSAVDIIILFSCHH